MNKKPNVAGEAPDDGHAPADEPGRYRTGRSLGRTLYRRHDDGTEEFIGTLDTRALAALAVKGLNLVDP